MKTHLCKLSKQLTLIMLLLISISSVAYTGSVYNIGTINNNLEKSYLLSSYREKIYLQTDKKIYFTDENIWLKAFLVDATTHHTDTLSEYIYVELADKSDSIHARVKIKKDATGFNGHIKLNPELPAGNYELRAYSHWMLNFSDNSIFRKSIYIGHKAAPQVVCTESYRDAGLNSTMIMFRFADALNSPLSNTTIWVNQAKTKRKFITDNAGSISFQTEATDSANRKLVVSVEKPGIKFRQSYVIPDLSKDFDIRFFPESGVFLEDETQVVAFKAIGRDGLSVNVSGKLFNSDETEIIGFETTNNGMGKFSIFTQSGKTYYAIVTSESGVKKKIQLPLCQQSGVSLKLNYQRNTDLLYQVINHTTTPSDSLVLIAHIRGNVLFAFPLQSLTGKIKAEALPEGIVTFTVASLSGKAFCERLYFSRNFKLPICKMTSNKSKYNKRELASLDFNVQLPSGEPVDGNFAISVTDHRLVGIDSLADNIQSYLLFTSDLQGYIETPGLYFKDNSIVTCEKTDILMLTQGWHKFHAGLLNQKQTSKTRYYLEKGQFISGKVLNILNKPAKGIDVVALIPGKKVYLSAKTDSTGHFLIEGVDFNDSTMIFLKAYSRSKLIDVQIVPDSFKLPLLDNWLLKTAANRINGLDEYTELLKGKYYTEGGIRSINLGEITVKGQNNPQKQKSIYSSLADNVLSANTLKQMPGANIQSILLALPGVMPNGRSVSIRGQGEPLFLINGRQVDFDEVSFINTQEIEEIALITGSGTTFLGTRAMNGAIAITLTEGADMKKAPLLSLAKIMPLGYQKPEEFYVPKYEVDSIRQQAKMDYRTTLYWNPKLMPDKNGNMKVEFYTADKPGSYLITLEGIDKSGIICHYTSTVSVE